MKHPGLLLMLLVVAACAEDEPPSEEDAGLDAGVDAEVAMMPDTGTQTDAAARDTAPPYDPEGPECGCDWDGGGSDAN